MRPSLAGFERPLTVEARVLADRLVTLAVEYGFSDAELKKLKKMISGKLKLEWSESN